MREHKSAVAGVPVSVKVVEQPDDFLEFKTFIQNNPVMAVDTETTGLDIYSNDFHCRLAQFGNKTQAYVIPVELGPEFVELAREGLHSPKRLVLQNASYDLQVVNQTLGVPMELLWPKVIDTKILAHLVDPRGREEGGAGHSLADLTRRYLDDDKVADVLAAEHHTTMTKVWKKVPLDNPRYELYAGMDTILASNLAATLAPKVPVVSDHLIEFERQLAEVCSYIEQTGFLLDVDYAEKLSVRLKDEAGKWEEEALKYGCENIRSTEQLADALEKRGVEITETTPSGKRKVDDNLLGRLAGEGDPFAYAVIEAKRASKWRKTWVDKFLKGRDSDDRCHAHINPLRARTARMSITGIPAQTLPANDALIRNCFIADEGHSIASVDYRSQELRVLAALSGDKNMIAAFRNDLDLHQVTADAAGVDRKVGKMANFLKVYGGGAAKLSNSAGIDLRTASDVIRGFDRVYPQVQSLSDQLRKEASRCGHIVTKTGRVLPVDADRLYSALNYLIQSTSRDVTARALIRLHEAGLTEYVRLPIHDEILASVPTDGSAKRAAQIGELMTMTLNDVVIDTDPEVGGRSWGSLYENKV